MLVFISLKFIAEHNLNVFDMFTHKIKTIPREFLCSSKNYFQQFN